MNQDINKMKAVADTWASEEAKLGKLGKAQENALAKGYLWGMLDYQTKIEEDVNGGFLCGEQALGESTRIKPVMEGGSLGEVKTELLNWIDKMKSSSTKTHQELLLLFKRKIQSIQPKEGIAGVFEKCQASAQMCGCKSEEDCPYKDM